MGNSPGVVRDAVTEVLKEEEAGLTVSQITYGVERLIGKTVPRSSVQSSLQLRSNDIQKVERGTYRLMKLPSETPVKPRFDQSKATDSIPFFRRGNCRVYHSDCFAWLASARKESIHAVVTDPPYGLVEYEVDQQEKLREGKGGVWRIPPSYDGCKRSPLPRFTTLSKKDHVRIYEFFFNFADLLLPALVPGANVIIASNPLVSPLVSSALSGAGFERRGEIIRLVQTMRGGDRPKGHEDEFAGVSVMPRSQWEPWVVFRKPLDGTVAENLRKWKAGGFRRISETSPFGDVIQSHPTRKTERDLAPHPSLKPQDFMRKIVRGSLPLGEGVVLDPFCGAGSTLAAANRLGYKSIGIERDAFYYDIAKSSIPKLAKLEV